MKLRLAAAALAACWGTSALAGGLVFCDRATDITAADQDRMLRFSAVVKEELERSGAQVALVSRAGTDLSRFGIRYSHAGIALRDSPNGTWSVRQLYYACDESRPRVFDQGMAGFVVGADAARLGYVSMVMPSGPRADALASTALDKPLALTLLASDYSANAYAWATRYQNCNQWVAELMGFAWQPREVDASTPDRAQALRALRALGYDPTPVVVPSHAVMFAAQFVPLIHSDDHPLDDLYAMRLKVSTPAALETFVHQRVPQAQRIELCATGGEIVVRRGWQPLPPDCRAAPGDEILPLAS